MEFQKGLSPGPILFLIYINDLNEATLHSLIHYFDDDTNILFSNKPLKNISKYINHDIAQIVQWVGADCIITEIKQIILFQSKNKKK